mmetsp:Transcript_43258/g.84779  ORF Transcript_43258/g.84779 Transcript_43258/m.84779 type:complete len:273 (-) Transcript_43258:3130-3948(-)
MSSCTSTLHALSAACALLSPPPRSPSSFWCWALLCGLQLSAMQAPLARALRLPNGTESPSTVYTCSCLQTFLSNSTWSRTARNPPRSPTATSRSAVSSSCSLTTCSKLAPWQLGAFWPRLWLSVLGESFALQGSLMLWVCPWVLFSSAALCPGCTWLVRIAALPSFSNPSGSTTLLAQLPSYPFADLSKLFVPIAKKIGLGSPVSSANFLGFPCLILPFILFWLRLSLSLFTGLDGLASSATGCCPSWPCTSTSALLLPKDLAPFTASCSLS